VFCGSGESRVYRVCEGFGCRCVVNGDDRCLFDWYIVRVGLGSIRVDNETRGESCIDPSPEEVTKRRLDSVVLHLLKHIRAQEGCKMNMFVPRSSDEVVAKFGLSSTQIKSN
jgi:hypothetical protein